MTQHQALAGHSAHRTPQSEAIPGSDQVANSAGGFSWEVDCWQRLNRFLILGAEGGTYYVGQRDLVTQSVTAIDECLREDAKQTVKLIVEVSEAGRAASNDPAIFALAYCAKKGDLKTRQLAFAHLADVCRIGTHLFHFAQYVRGLGGFGSGTQRALAEWYNRDVEKVAWNAVKYRQRDGWSHRDLLRLAHVKPATEQHNALFKWIVSGELPVHRTTDETQRVSAKGYEFDTDKALKIVEGYELAQKSDSPEHTARLIRAYGLPREAVQTDHLNDVAVWKALLEKMPYGALIRNLATMTRNGTLESGSDELSHVLATIGDKELISKSRIHPIAVLAALKTYESGHSARGSATWTPIAQIVDALDGAFYDAFGNVEGTGARIRLALDVSGSMDWGEINGVPGLTPRVGAAAMSLVTAKSEVNYDVVAFTRTLTNLTITPRQRLDDVLKLTDHLPFGGTDCAQPIIDALEKGLKFDAFVVYTDSETWAGRVHPAQALAEYRRKTGIAAKLIVVGMEGNDFSIADPADPGMLDVVGFDTNTPQMISDFISDKL